jgi:hypothetical protein
MTMIKFFSLVMALLYRIVLLLSIKFLKNFWLPGEKSIVDITVNYKKSFSWRAL